jgi:hypothetical protein
MKKALFILSYMLLLSGSIFAQAPAKRPVPRMQKVEISKTGCSLYMPGSPEFNISKSEDGSDVYIGEVEFDGFRYAVVCVKFAEAMPEKEGRVDLLISYMNFLQGQFGITAAAGYGKGHTLESNPNADGVIDYWVDETENEWAVKGWIDGNYLAVLCLYGAEEHPYFSVQQMFLDGFRFPGK